MSIIGRPRNIMSTKIMDSSVCLKTYPNLLTVLTNTTIDPLTFLNKYNLHIEMTLTGIEMLTQYFLFL